MKADLHVHSTASDGSVSPSGLVDLALDASLDVLSITDHDSVEGIAEALEAAVGSDLRVVPGVELSAAQDDRDVHVLAYFVDPHDPALLARLTELRAARMRRAERMVARLREGGYELTMDAVLARSAGGAVGRSHIAAVLVEAGHADTMGEAFRELIGRDRPFYVAKDNPRPAAVVAMLRDLGAVPVLAHPGTTGDDDLVPELVEAGLAGIEAYHADHTPAQRDHYAAMAARFGLITTGGSDFHGPSSPNPGLGTVDVPEAAVRDLLALGDARG